MAVNISDYINPIKILVFATLVFAMLKLDRRKPVNRDLIMILGICAATELITSLFIFFDIRHGFSTTVSVIFHHSMWLLLLSRVAIFKRPIVFSIGLFVVLGVINLLFYEGIVMFNYYTFVAGAMLYLVILIAESFYRLFKEDFTFFLTNSFFLVFAPVVFFFGLGMMFAFKSKVITSQLLFGHLKLYYCIIYFVNVLYYLLICVYIYKEAKLRRLADERQELPVG